MNTVRPNHAARGISAVLIVALLAAEASAAPPASPGSAAAKDAAPPNILFIVMDDVGIDQLGIFNPLGVTTPATPVLDQIAAKGVKFTNFYTMPECSPSRAAFVTGRYPLRTGVTAALLPEDLPAAQISPYEVAIPKVLETAGYTSAMLGKYHLGGPDNNPDGFRGPAVLGWDYYSGNLSGGPPAIDASLGGQYDATADPDTYSCGFPIGKPKGACWMQTTGGKAQLDDNGGAGWDGKVCVENGGIPALDASGEPTLSCGPESGCVEPDFTRLNAYYVWEKTTVDRMAVHRSIERGYMTTSQTDESIAWIRRQKKNPWMATVSYNADHILYQPPPDSLYPPGAPANLPHTCSTADLGAQRILSNRMIEAMDKEIGRLLVETGLAEKGGDGRVVYSPERSNTMVVVVGDNGSFLPSVKYPYSITRSKGSVYETGVKAPLIVAGPLVSQPGRKVEALSSCVDLFELFGEIAGLDVHEVVPPEHTLDSSPLLPYLTSASQAPLRSEVFAQLGNGLKPPSFHIWPCVLSFGGSQICTDILLTSEAICTAAGGDSWGPEHADEHGGKVFDTCCDVATADPPVYDTAVDVVAPRSWAIRNEHYKLVRVDRPVCDSSPPDELYELEPRPLDPVNPLGIDNAEDNLLLAPLLPEAQQNYEQLTASLDEMLASEAVCPGDGNLDKRVDRRDIVGVRRNKGEASVFDFDADGETDRADLAIVREQLGTECTNDH